MRITFAYPRVVGGRQYAPDETADIDDAVARELVREGFARRAPKSAASTTKARAQTKGSEG